MNTVIHHENNLKANEYIRNGLEEIRQDKKKLEETIQQLGRDFEEKYPGFKIEEIKSYHCNLRGDMYGKFFCDLNIKIPWL